MAAGPRDPRGRWWIAPVVVVGLVVLAWLVMAGMPFRDDSPPKPVAQTETIAEAPAEAEGTGTVVEVPPGASDDSFEIATTTIQAPPIAPGPAPTTATAQPSATTTTMPPPMTSSPSAPAPRPPVIVAEQPRPASRPTAQRQPATRPPVTVARTPQPAPAPVRVVPRTERVGEITASDAEATLQSYVRSRRYYPVASECVRVENRGYRNVGYNLEVWHSCGGGGSSRLLGRWRVDSKTREVFRQRDDGRYVRP